MEQWFAHIAGQQYGPVSREELIQWLREGRLGPQDLVWRDGMANWLPAGTVPELSGVGPGPQGAPGEVPPPLNPAGGWAGPVVTGVGVQSGSAAGGQMVPPRSGGSGGQWPNEEINRFARQRLKGRWALAILFTFLLATLREAMGIFSYLMTRAAPGPGGIIMMGGLNIVLAFLLAGAFAISAAAFFLTLARGGEANLDMLFSGFRRFGAGLLAMLLMILCYLGLVIVISIILGIAGGILLAVSARSGPGAMPDAMFLIMGITYVILLPLVIYLALGFSQTFFVLADDTSMGGAAALGASWRMMRQRRWKLFCLYFRYFLWALPGLAITWWLTFRNFGMEPFDFGRNLLFGLPALLVGIFVGAYAGTGTAIFYDDMQSPAPPTIAPIGAPPGA